MTCSATGSRGSNPLACRTGFIGYLFLWIGTGSNPVGLRSVWKLEARGFKSCGLSGRVLKGFCLERKL